MFIDETPERAGPWRMKTREHHMRKKKFGANGQNIYLLSGEMEKKKRGTQVGTGWPKKGKIVGSILCPELQPKMRIWGAGKGRLR